MEANPVKKLQITDFDLKATIGTGKPLSAVLFKASLTPRFIRKSQTRIEQAE